MVPAAGARGLAACPAAHPGSVVTVCEPNGTCTVGVTDIPHGNVAAGASRHDDWGFGLGFLEVRCGAVDGWMLMK